MSSHDIPVHKLAFNLQHVELRIAFKGHLYQVALPEPVILQEKAHLLARSTCQPISINPGRERGEIQISNSNISITDEFYGILIFKL